MHILKRIIRALWRRVYRWSKPAENDLDRKLAKYLNYRNGFFIEVGANDGYAQSNTYYLEKKLGWRGVLIEAIPELYERCRKRRKRSRVFHCALVADTTSQPTVTMHFANLMSVADGALKTPEAQEEHIRVGLKVQRLPNNASYTIEVPARTLTSLLDEINPPLVDFFSLDVEGYELQVLQGLDLSRYRPTYILVEARFFDEVNAYLQPYYDLVERMTYHDYFYKVRQHLSDSSQ